MVPRVSTLHPGGNERELGCTQTPVAGSCLASSFPPEHGGCHPSLWPRQGHNGLGQVPAMEPIAWSTDKAHLPGPGGAQICPYSTWSLHLKAFSNFISIDPQPLKYLYTYSVNRVEQEKTNSTVTIVPVKSLDTFDRDHIYIYI